MPFFKALSAALLPTPEQLEESDAVEEVVFIGYPNSIYDEVNLVPVVRRGITATPPQLDYGGKPRVLIDAAVFPGSSGSPVFVWNPVGLASSRPGRPFLGTTVYFLGVLASGFLQEQNGRIEMVPIPTAMTPIPITPQLINLGTVHKAHTVVETIDHLLRTTGKW